MDHAVSTAKSGFSWVLDQLSSPTEHHKLLKSLAVTAACVAVADVVRRLLGIRRMYRQLAPCPVLPEFSWISGSVIGVGGHSNENKDIKKKKKEGRKEKFYLMTHSTHFIYGYMASDIWLRTILIVRKETRCRHIGYSFRLTARVLLYAPSHRQNSTYHGLCYTSRRALSGMRNSSMGPSHEGSIRRPIAP